MQRGYLKGLRVLDLSRLLPGPYASLMLAEMGAEVVKVEDTGIGDSMRTLPPVVNEMGVVYTMLNRGKRNLSINLKDERGRQILLDLVKCYDIVLEGFRPGTLDKLGLDYETLKAANPGVILCSISGYGQSGPYRLRAGHDLNYQALAGIVEMTGRRHEQPGMPGAQMADLAGSLMAVNAILAAVFQRVRTGEGAQLDISMCDNLLSLQPFIWAELAADGHPTRGETVLSGRYLCYHIYETADGRSMSFAALEPKFFQAFCEAVNRPEMMEYHFTEVSENSEPYLAMCELFKSRTQAEWIDLLKDVDACCEPVISPAEAPSREMFIARKLFFPLEIGEGLRIPMVPTAPFAPDRAPDLKPAASLGEHSQEILRELGLNEQEIAELQKNGVIRC